MDGQGEKAILKVMKSAAESQPVFTAQDEAGFNLGTHFWTAMVVLVGLIAQMIYLPVGWEFDMNSPDFNPMVFLPILLMAVIGWQLIKAGLFWWHLRKFGVATMELHGSRSVVMGGVCRGVVRTERALKAEGDFEIVLRCVEVYRFQQPGTVSREEGRYHHVTAWEKALLLSSVGKDSSAGLPFQFELPKLGPLAQFIEPATAGNKPYFKMKVSLNIPGLKKRVITHNQKPNARQWWLDLKASTSEGAFRVSFQVPVEE